VHSCKDSALQESVLLKLCSQLVKSHCAFLQGLCPTRMNSPKKNAEEEQQHHRAETDIREFFDSLCSLLVPLIAASTYVQLSFAASSLTLAYSAILAYRSASSLASATVSAPY